MRNPLPKFNIRIVPIYKISLIARALAFLLVIFLQSALPCLSIASNHTLSSDIPASDSTHTTAGTATSLIKQSVRKVTAQLTSLTNRQNIHEIEGIIKRYFLPHTDKERIAKLVLGSHWKKASIPQKQAFIDCFTRQLFNAYAQSFSQYKGEPWSVIKTEFNSTKSKAAVYLKISTLPEPSELIFRLYQTNKNWVIYDLSKNQISLVKNYRDQYASLIHQQGLAKTLAILCKTFPDKAKTLILAGGHWPPFIAKGLPGNGFSVEVVTSVLKKAGYNLKVIYATWGRVTQGMQESDYDVSLGTWYSNERNQFLKFSDPYYENQLVLLAQSTADERINTHDQFILKLKSHKSPLGLIEDYAYGDIIPPNTTTQLYKHYTTLLVDLAKGSLSYSLIEKSVAGFHLSLQPALRKNVSIVSDVLYSLPLHMTVARHNSQADDIIHRFNKQLAIYKKSAEYQALLNQFRMQY